MQHHLSTCICLNLTFTLVDAFLGQCMGSISSKTELCKEQKSFIDICLNFVAMFVDRFIGSVFLMKDGD